MEQMFPCSSPQEANCASAPVSTAPIMFPPERPELFRNDDACGDLVLPIGNGLQLQTFNALSAGLFVLSGAQLLLRAETQFARSYGFMMCLVGVGSFSFHATSSLTGFLIDVAPMAVSAALLVCKAIHALQADAAVGTPPQHRDPKAETCRFGLSAGAAFLAVYVPWLMMQFGFSHYKVWGVWALLFGSMGAGFGVVSLFLLFEYGLLRGRIARDFALSVFCLLLGLGCTTHSFLPGLCSPGAITRSFPFHSLWHLFSSISSNRIGHLLEVMTKLTAKIERATEVAPPRKKAPLLLRMTRDALPSQFSM